MFKEWCKRVHTHASTATEHAEDLWETKAFKSLAFDLLSNDLTPEQCHDAKYKIRKDTKTGEISVTTKQRSWINIMLREDLGHSRVAYFIFNHGLPDVLDLSFGKKAPGKAMLQNMLDELMIWYGSLLQSILEHQSHPDMANARKLAGLDQKMWQMHRRERKLKAKQRMVQGSSLMKERDSGKRNFDDMSATEQQVLEDYETDKSAKRYKKECGKKLPLYRG